MKIINDISSQRFTLDGIEYLKNFLSRVYGNKITIYNAYDKDDVLIENELYTNVEVNGVVYSSAALLQQALLSVIYTRATLGGIVQDSPYFNYFNNIEGFDLAGQDLTIYANWAWTIQGGAHTNLSDVVINIPLATSGYHRIDIVVANQNDTFELIQGVEVLLANTAAEPTTPVGTLKATSLNVTDGTVSTGDTPITGTDFVKKTYALNYSYSTGTTNAVYALRENGASVYTLTNAGLVSVSGFDLSLIVGSAESPYSGKTIRLLNQTGNNITLKHFDDTNAEIPFYLKEGIDLVVPNNETIEFYYSGAELTETFRSWDSDILNTILTGLVASSGTFTASDNVLTAFDKIKFFIDNFPVRITQYLSSMNLTNANTWRGWNVNTSNMLVADAATSYGTGTEPTKVGTWFADSNVIYLKDLKRLKKLTFHTRNFLSNVTFQLYVVVADYGIRGNELNGVIIINENTVVAGAGSFMKDNFTIASHTLNANSIIQVFYRQVSGTTQTPQGVQFIWEFEK